MVDTLLVLKVDACEPQAKQYVGSDPGVAPGIVQQVKIAKEQVAPYVFISGQTVFNLGIRPAKPPLRAPVVIKVPANTQATEGCVVLLDPIVDQAAVEHSSYKPVDVIGPVSPARMGQRNAPTDIASMR